MEHFDVKKIRLIMGLSQNQFALKLGMAQGTLAKIEGGTLKLNKYVENIQAVTNEWKEYKVRQLEKEIEFIKSL